MICLLSDVVEKIREKNLDFQSVTRINGLNSSHIVTVHFLQFFPRLTHFDGTVRIESRVDIEYLSQLNYNYLILDLQGRITDVEFITPLLGMGTLRLLGAPRFHGHPKISEVEISNLEFKFLLGQMPVQSYTFWRPLMANHRINSLHADGLPLEFLNDLPSNIKLLMFNCHEAYETISRLNPRYEIGCYGIILNPSLFHVNRYITQMNFPYREPEKMLELNGHLKSLGISISCQRVISIDKIRVGWYRTNKQRDLLLSKYPGIRVIKSLINLDAE